MHATMRTMKLPDSSYFINELGDVLNWEKKVLPIEIIDGKKMVKLFWIYGERFYDAAVVMLVASQKVQIPLNLIDEIEPLFIDENSNNLFLGNLIYRFKNGPLECEDFPGFYYVPFFTRYVLNREGLLLARKDGKRMAFYTVPPRKNRPATNGYKYSRLVVDEGVNKLAGLHRILCYTFKKYGSNVNKLLVNHIDGIPAHNTVENLEFVTAKENIQHAVKTGLKTRNMVPIQLWDLNTNKITSYTNIAECRDTTNIHRNNISYRLHANYNTKPRDGLVFKYNDGSPWPVFDGCEVADMYQQNQKLILARNVFTNDVFQFAGTLNGQEITGVKAATIYNQVDYEPRIPYNGFIFRYKSNDLVWPEYSERELLVYKDFPIYPGDGVIVTNVLTNEETFYTSKENAAKAHYVKEQTILTYILLKTLVDYKYKFTLFQIRDRNGPVYQ